MQALLEFSLKDERQDCDRLLFTYTRRDLIAPNIQISCISSTLIPVFM